MKLASLKSGRDGQLVVVSRDLTRATAAYNIADTLQEALENWETVAPLLAVLSEQLEHDSVPSIRFHEHECTSPLPRAYQWVDGSAYVNHVELVRRARGAEMPPSFWTDPLMYQGGSDSFLAPCDPIPMADQAYGIDFEAEVAVVTTDVPMGVSSADAGKYICLILLVNDVSLRNLIPGELAKGFGFLQSKPSSAFSPVAVTPEELGKAWDGGKVHLPLIVDLNGKPFGRANAGVDMTFNFPALIAHAAKTRPLAAGTIIGSGTVSNRDGTGGPGRPVSEGVLGGVPRRGIFDNMKTAVDRIGSGKARQVNARFSAMASHYLFEPEFCNPASGWEKGQIEKNVQDARRRLWQPMPRFPDLNALNAWLEERCVMQWRDIQNGILPGTIAEAHAEEALSLMPLGRPFDGFVEHSKRVSPTCLVNFERNRYSVPASFANRPVSLRAYPEKIIIAAEGQVLCEHARVIERSHNQPARTIYDWRHYLAVIQRKPGALRNGAPFVDLPDAFRQLQGHLLKRAGGDREMVEILALVLQHDEQAVLCAVEMALDAGIATKTHILNLLHRLIDGKQSTVAPIDAPQALSLRLEPKANTARYDGLRRKEASRAS